MYGELILYITACLLIPALWGWFVYWLFSRLDLKRWIPPPQEAPPGAPSVQADMWDYQI